MQCNLTPFEIGLVNANTRKGSGLNRKYFDIPGRLVTVLPFKLFINGNHHMSESCYAW